METHKVYVAGPMRGVPNFNFPAFDRAAANLRARGFTVFNPAERDRERYGTKIEDNPDGDEGAAAQKIGLSGLDLARECFGADTAWICAEATMIALLPGWERSNGARAESALGAALGIQVVELDPVTLDLQNPESFPLPDGMQSRDSKPTNPKDVIGSDKIPLHLWPETATALGCLGMLEGALKYGRSNFRAVGVRASIYVDATRRHVGAWFEGEDIDPDSGLPHMAHALACLAILVEAQAKGNMTDDRMFPTNFRQHIDTLTPHVKRLREKYAGRSPKHYTIEDSPDR